MKRCTVEHINFTR